MICSYLIHVFTLLELPESHIDVVNNASTNSKSFKCERNPILIFVSVWRSGAKRPHYGRVWSGRLEHWCQLLHGINLI